MTFIAIRMGEKSDLQNIRLMIINRSILKKHEKSNESEVTNCSSGSLYSPTLFRYTGNVYVSSKNVASGIFKPLYRVHLRIVNTFEKSEECSLWRGDTISYKSSVLVSFTCFKCSSYI